VSDKLTVMAIQSVLEDRNKEIEELKEAVRVLFTTWVWQSMQDKISKKYPIIKRVMEEGGGE